MLCRCCQNMENLFLAGFRGRWWVGWAKGRYACCPSLKNWGCYQYIELVNVPTIVSDWSWYLPQACKWFGVGWCLLCLGIHGWCKCGESSFVLWQIKQSKYSQILLEIQPLIGVAGWLMIQRCKAFKWHLGTKPLISMTLQTVSSALGNEKCHSNSAAELLLCCAHANVQCCHAAVNRYHSICSMLHVEMHSRIWSQQAFGRNQPPLRRLQWTAFEIPRPEM